jgi:serine/threonine protein kinase
MKDRLVVLSQVGRGASSVVYKAFDTRHMRLVALKTVPIFDRAKRHQMVRELDTLYKHTLLRHRDDEEQQRRFIVDFYDAYR